MLVQNLVNISKFDFFTGVPDSQLKPLCDYLMNTYGTDPSHHIIAANEGNSVAIAAGYHMATGKVPVVYMQNSGEGNIVNPVASLLNTEVYAIPMIFIIGWRGEPGIHDEPQHVYQGQVTLKLLDDMDIEYFIIDKTVNISDIEGKLSEWNERLKVGKQVAFIVKKGALEYNETVQYGNSFSVLREEAIQHILNFTGESPIISTTGKASRELFEIREAKKQSHKFDFLTVGAMGHASSIALGVALNKPNQKVWCIDGDGAMLMHMGALAVIGAIKPQNLIHILLNNLSHETVGGMPTVAGNVNVVELVKSCGYPNAVSVDTLEELDDVLAKVKHSNELFFIEVKCALGARANLGRPTKSAVENKRQFMQYLKDN